MSEPWVVDTNVGVVANDRLDDRPDPPHRPDSISSCVNFLVEVMRSGRVAIDDAWEIIREYRARMRSSGQPGPGDAFLKWVLVNQANPARCHRVDITGIAVPDRLAGFDPADHKFIQTALGCTHPRIAQAVDSLWWKRRTDFDTAGIEVTFLCPEEIKASSDRKHGPDPATGALPWCPHMSATPGAPSSTRVREMRKTCAVPGMPGRDGGAVDE